jgi:membrane protein
MEKSGRERYVPLALSSPADPDRAPPSRPNASGSRGDRARAKLDAARTRFERSWVDDLIKRVRALDVFAWTSEFGAEMLWSVLPLLILLSALANERIDDDLSRHIGLDNQGAGVLRGLFRSSPSHALIPILTGLLVSLAGTLNVVESLQVLYERVFEQQPRGWRGLPRFVVWLLVLLGALVLQAIIGGPVRTTAGPVIQGLVSFAAVTAFFAWTMHFLLAGRVPWRLVLRPALVTGVLWLCVALFSSLYFSSAVVSDSKDYGAVGVIFTLLTWFILIGVAIVLGAVFGAYLQARSARAATDSG